MSWRYEARNVSMGRIGLWKVKRWPDPTLPSDDYDEAHCFIDTSDPDAAIALAIQQNIWRSGVSARGADHLHHTTII